MTDTRYSVYKMRLAGYLMMQGFPLLDIGTNAHNSNYRVFYFADNAQLRETIAEYFSKQSNKQNKE